MTPYMKRAAIADLLSEVTKVPPVLDQKTYPSLNGLRGISIMLVVIYHLMLVYGDYRWHNVMFIGKLGVNIFFVISGFLITTLCIKEKINTGKLSISKFYIRRALRILPVAYLYLATVAVLSYFFKFDVTFPSIAIAFFFVANISIFTAHGSNWYVAHYWSLSTEEQFYLFFPVLLKKRFGFFIAAVAIIPVIVPFLMFMQQVVPALNFGLLSAILRYLAKFQGIAIGCLSSVLLFKGYLNITKNRLLITVAAIAVMALVRFDVDLDAPTLSLNLISSICTALVIICNISHQNNWFYRFLNLKAMNLIGVLSFSIYIWQQPFTSGNPNFPPSKFPWNVLILIAVACLSYYIYEKPFLKLKSRFHSKTKKPDLVEAGQ